MIAWYIKESSILEKDIYYNGKIIQFSYFIFLRRKRLNRIKFLDIRPFIHVCISSSRSNREETSLTPYISFQLKVGSEYRISKNTNFEHSP